VPITTSSTTVGPLLHRPGHLDDRFQVGLLEAPAFPAPLLTRIAKKKLTTIRRCKVSSALTLPECLPDVTMVAVEPKGRRRTAHTSPRLPEHRR
jgi:hypothetical protein